MVAGVNLRTNEIEVTLCDQCIARLKEEKAPPPSKRKKMVNVVLRNGVPKTIIQHV